MTENSTSENNLKIKFDNFFLENKVCTLKMLEYVLRHFACPFLNMHEHPSTATALQEFTTEL